ncbi:MAG: diphosphomevalonate decarboxylase [Pseudomonadota bacterium]|nr:diphosphomevalonate decarboxylase [Pseudomonadota bacterium]
MPKNSSQQPKIQYVANAPSNIAFLKYWGKDGKQWASNDSISMTLSKCETITQATDSSDDRVYLHGEYLNTDSKHGRKIYRHLQFLRTIVGVEQALEIHSHNTFPLACGIASSASGMAALTIAALACWTRSSNLTELAAAGYPLAKLAALARQGSGSACRSFWGGIVQWERGDSPATQRTYQLMPANDWQLADVIVCAQSPVSKDISSSAGHALAQTSPLFTVRRQGMPEKIKHFRQALQQHDFVQLGMLIEAEALEFIQVMATSTPPLSYLTQDLYDLLAFVRACRQRDNLPAYFTVDAGAAVHIICVADVAEQIRQKIQRNFHNFMIIVDKIGAVPRLHSRPAGQDSN